MTRGRYVWVRDRRAPEAALAMVRTAFAIGDGEAGEHVWTIERVLQGWR